MQTRTHSPSLRHTHTHTPDCASHTHTPVRRRTGEAAFSAIFTPRGTRTLFTKEVKPSIRICDATSLPAGSGNYSGSGSAEQGKPSQKIRTL